MVNSEAVRKIEEFVSGVDTSREAADMIEVAMDDSYPDDDYVQKTVEMLAMYQPDGGDFLFDAATMQQRLKNTMQYMRELG